VTRVGVALMALTVAIPCSAQQTVTGRVISAEDGEPLEEVTVRVVGEGIVLGTDSTGAFSFRLPDGRPGFALEIEVIGFTPFNRTWLLPLERPLVVALEREAIPLEGIDVEVDPPTGWTARPLEYKLDFRVRSLMGIDRTASAADLRGFEHQGAEIWDFLPQMNVGYYGLEGFIANGLVPRPGFVIDDRNVVFDEFRSYPVEEICRLDVVTFPRPGATKGGLVMAYTCEFLMDVVTGEERLTPFLPGNGVPGRR